MARWYGSLFALALLVLLFAAAPASAQWIKDGVPVCTQDYYQVNLRIAPDGENGAVIVWMDYRIGFDWDIYGNRVDATGVVMGPAEGIPICTAPNSQYNPELVPDGTGGGIAVWDDERDVYRRIYAQRVDGEGIARWTADGMLVSDTISQQQGGCIISDGAGGAIFAWVDYRSLVWHIYAQRIDADGNRLWTEKGVEICADPAEQYSPRIVSDGAGGAVIAWEDNRSGSGTDIYAQRIDAGGNLLWGADAAPVCTYPGYESNIRLAESVGGGAIVTWYDSRNGYGDIFAQRLSPDGLPLWTIDGEAVCPGAWGKYGAGAAGDGSGGVIVAWWDERDGYSYTIYAQRFDQDGNPAWQENGILAIPSYSGESEIRIIADGSGGVILAADVYPDEESPADIYAQRLSHDGFLLWGSTGIVVCGASSDQYAPALALDGAGGALFGWEDYRGNEGYADAYCQRIGPSGLWGDATPEIVSCLDVPGDQGGWVRIRTRASSHDPLGGIFGYNVWRMIDGGGGPIAAASDVLARLIDPAKAKGVRVDAAQAAVLGLPEGEWEAVGFWFATRDTIYNAAVPTRNDSTEAGTAEETFIVTAHTATPGLFVASEAAVGYSVDNLAPGMTPGFAGDEVASPHGLRLTWTDNAAPDLWKYDIHRGDDEFFTPDPASFIGSTEGTEYFDGDWVKAYMQFYKLVAVDRHGNMSPAALLRPEDINVGALLQAYAASLAGSYVEITWTISELGTGTSFHIMRSEGAAFAELSSAAITREALSFRFADRSVEPGTTYRYRVEIEDESGRRTLFETDAIETPAMPITLHQNHPNPFNPSTAIGYYLPEACAVTLEVYDAAGKLVSRLRDGVKENRGTHTVEWRGTDDAGRAVSSGVYFYRLRAGRETLSRKMILLR